MIQTSYCLCKQVWSSTCWQSSLKTSNCMFADVADWFLHTIYWWLQHCYLHFYPFFYPHVTFTSCSGPRRFENGVKFESGKLLILWFYIYFIPVHTHLCVFTVLFLNCWKTLLIWLLFVQGARRFRDNRRQVLRFEMGLMFKNEMGPGCQKM